MVTRTLTATVDVQNAAMRAEQYTRLTRIIRNMDFLKLRDRRNVVPIRTETNPSPMKQAASNRQPGQSHTRTTVDEAINNELAKAQYLTDDLADHLFGHIVSTELARDILRQFVDDGIVQIFEGMTPRHEKESALDPESHSEDIQRAIEEASQDSHKHGCIRTNTESNASKTVPSSTGGQGHTKDSKGKGKQQQKGYSFKWNSFPAEPIDEDELVKFLNEITDRAFDFAQHKLDKAVQRLNNRFAARVDKNHAMPLSYEPDGEDMRPDFLLLPMEAFLDDFKTVDPKYLNFTASRLVGEAKNKDLAAGVEQVQRYARGLKRAQPWVHYVLAMTITKDKAVFMRGEGSGIEHLEMVLADGRGCIEFIRILLGLALAEDVVLGQNPDIFLDRETRMCDVNRSNRHSPPSKTPSSTTASRTKKITDATSVVVSSSAAPKELPISSRTRSASKAASVSSHAITSSSRTLDSLRKHALSASSTSSKRIHSELGEGDSQEAQRKRRKTVEIVVKNEHVIFFPLRVYGHTCLGILFISSSIRGRGTTVFCVLDLDDPETRLAFKMSWQDLERIADQDAVVKRLREHEPHPNVIVPHKTFNALRHDQMCTTLGAIRGFLDDQMDLIHVENRVLTISASELKRPVAYFWGLHDFVRGLRGALLGHEYLTKIGILHRDISENNIVLGLYPWEERGYLIDFDMAILQEDEKSTGVPLSGSEPQPQIVTTEQDERKHVKGLRTGTFPYISFGVLLGKKHTFFNDVESFLYVLLLFFFSYAGPLPKVDLQNAHRQGFVRSIGSGRLPHLRSWPEKFANWADGNPSDIAESKYLYVATPKGPDFLVESAEFQKCLKNNWPEDLHNPIRSLLLSTFTSFRESPFKTKEWRVEVSHAQFIKILDEWLETHSALEHVYSDCPDFADFRNIDSTGYSN